MSVLQLGAHMSIAGGVSYALDRAASVQSNAVQVFTKNNRQWRGPPVDAADVARWHSQRQALGIVYAASHASYLINLASPQEDLWTKSLLAYQDELVRAHAYALPHVVLHPGAHTGAGDAAGIARLARALNQIHEQTPACADTVTCLEIMAGQGSVLGSTLAQLRAILEQIDDRRRVGVCLDTCHAFAAGYDLRGTAGYTRFLQEVEQWLGLETIKVWHVNDSKGTLGSRLDRHVQIGAGELGLEGFRPLLNDLRWEGVAMLLETPKDATLADDVLNLAQLCALVEDPSRLPAGLRNAVAPSAGQSLWKNR